MATLNFTKTFVDGVPLTGAELNQVQTDVQNWSTTVADDNVAAAADIDPSKIGDYSANAAEMQTTADPYPAGSESLATTLEGELGRIRYVINQLMTAAGLSPTQWYDDTNLLGVHGFSTGDVKLTIKTTADTGWVMMDDGTISDAGNGGTTRQHADCEDLFTLIWNNIVNVRTNSGSGTVTATAANDQITITAHGLGAGDVVAFSGLTTTPDITASKQTIHSVIDANTVYLDDGSGGILDITVGDAGGDWILDIVQDNTGVTVVKGASAAADFGANNRRVKLPVALGRALAVADAGGDGTAPNGTAHALGAVTGDETHTLATSEMPAHTHTQDMYQGGGDGNRPWSRSTTASAFQATSNSTGGGGAHNNMQSSAFFNVMIKL